VTVAAVGLPGFPQIISCYASGALYWFAGLAVAWLAPKDADYGNWPSALIVAAVMWPLAPFWAFSSAWHISDLSIPSLSLRRLDILPVAVWLILVLTGRARRWQQPLALACLDRPGVDLARYHEHLESLAREVGDAVAGAELAAQRLRALTTVISERRGYRGDSLTYDDLQNANLMRVIDRRKGLPVALGILYLHAGRAQGWDIAGLAFPGHFLLRLEGIGGFGILDPFSGASIEGAAELRALLKAIAGADRELAAEHYATVADREVLLRLQNNRKLRLLQGGDLRFLNQF